MSELPVQPLIPGPWKSLDADEARAVVERLHATLPPDGHGLLQRSWPISGLRAVPLSFYPGWLLIEGEAAFNALDSGTFNVLFGPGVLLLIDGTSSVVHDVNSGLTVSVAPAAPVAGAAGEALAAAARTLPAALAALDESVTGPDYLHFFCGSVWGEEGPFTVVESPDLPEFALIENGMDDWRERIRPVTMHRDGDALVARAAVRYGNTLFQATFRIASGLVNMEEDEPIAKFSRAPEPTHCPFRAIRRRPAVAG